MRPSKERQLEIASEFEARENSQAAALAALDDVLDARMGVEM
jgi:hypothetical protein